MRYGWLLLLSALLGVIIFSNYSLGPKNFLLASLNNWQPTFEPATREANGRQFLLAKIHSTYPFNHRGLISVNAGSDHSVKPETVVTVEGKFLLGKVTETFQDYSLAKTIFDNDWNSPIRIGTQEIDALLLGGQEPLATTIDKKAEVAAGDVVYIAGRGFPYGLAIGTIREVYDSPTAAFKAAKLDFDYNFNEIKELWLLLK